MAASRAANLISFINQSCSSFHAVDSVKRLLKDAGFVEISESQSWSIRVGGSFFYTRNQSTIVAFAVGHKYKSGHGFNIVAAHTDSPNLKVKPISKVQNEGYLQVGVEPYGGGLWYTWFDRDLTVAGRVNYRRGNDQFASSLVKIDRPILRIPTLCIHLDRTANERLEINKENHLLPVLATSIQEQLANPSPAEAKPPVRHHSALVSVLAKELGCEAADIVNFDLSVCDATPGVIGGVHNEFIFSPRIDNLFMTYCATQALIDSLSDSLENETNVRAVLLFDNEEVGNESAYGAACPMLSELVNRVTSNLSTSDTPKEAQELSYRRSFVISADMAHAVHPNYASKHEAYHKPAFHKGLVIKYNANQRYATTSETAFYILRLAELHKIPVQEFAVRNDSACGTTIGPILSSLTGIRTVDVGAPQLSMHSIREMAATTDVDHSISLFSAFFQEFSKLDGSLKIDAQDL